MEENRTAYRIMEGKHTGKKQLEDLGVRNECWAVLIEL